MTIITSLTLYEGTTIMPKIINSSPKYRCFIFTFFNCHFSRTLSIFEKLEVRYLDPAFKKYKILEAPDDLIMIVLDTCDDYP